MNLYLSPVPLFKDNYLSFCCDSIIIVLTLNSKFRVVFFQSSPYIIPLSCGIPHCYLEPPCLSNYHFFLGHFLFFSLAIFHVLFLLITIFFYLAIKSLVLPMRSCLPSVRRENKKPSKVISYHFF